MIYGYARVSTVTQAKDGNSLEAQEAALKSHGATQIFSDTFTGSNTERPQLNHLLEIVQDGDYVLVTKLDRFARNVSSGIDLIEKFSSKGVSVHVLNIGIIDNSSTGKLIRNIMLSFAEFERDMIIQRTQEGKQIAKKNPNYREGRPKKFSIEQLSHAMELLKSNSYAQVSKMTGISKSTLIRTHRNTN